MSESREEGTELKAIAGTLSPAFEVDAIAALARGGAFSQNMELDGPEFIVVPKESKVHTIDPTALLPRFADSPERATGTYHPATVEAFVDYVKEQVDGLATTVWVPVTQGTIVAVINDHGATSKGWGDFRAELGLQTTPEWDHWIGRNNQMGGQEEFANHIEEGLGEITSPDGATLLEVAQSIHAKADVKFKSAKRLSDGRTQMEYSEDIDTTAGDGSLKIPSEFELAIAPFAGEPAYKVTARLRYRISSGGLTIGYKLDRPELVKRDAFEQIAERLKKEFSRVYMGAPAPSRGIQG